MSKEAPALDAERKYEGKTIRTKEDALNPSADELSSEQFFDRVAGPNMPTQPGEPAHYGENRAIRFRLRERAGVVSELTGENYEQAFKQLEAEALRCDVPFSNYQKAAQKLKQQEELFGSGARGKFAFSDETEIRGELEKLDGSLKTAEMQQAKELALGFINQVKAFAKQFKLDIFPYDTMVDFVILENYDASPSSLLKTLERGKLARIGETKLEELKDFPE